MRQVKENDNNKVHLTNKTVGRESKLPPPTNVNDPNNREIQSENETKKTTRTKMLLDWNTAVKIPWGVLLL
ncbi:MAG: hypothetical protein ACRD8W_24625, partial [Nitrososphaeraceae archaeon]